MDMADNQRSESSERGVTQFSIGDRVSAIALPNAFPRPVDRREGLQVVMVKRIECASMAPYYRVLAIGDYGVMVEGAERFFEREGS